MTLKSVRQMVDELRQRLHPLDFLGGVDEGPAMAKLTCEVTYTREQFIAIRNRFESTIEGAGIIRPFELQNIAAALGEVERLQDPDGDKKYFAIRSPAWLHLRMLRELLREPIEVHHGDLGMVMIEFAMQLDATAPRTAEVIASFGAELTEMS